MPFDWRDYLDLAVLLQRQGSGLVGEASFRCAASRAYYAGFCHARNYARDQHGFDPTYDVSDHRRVREHFQRRGMLRIASKLSSLRQWRNTCDYKDTVHNSSRLCASAIAAAQEVFVRLV